jgi:hypothetical protein
MMKIWMKIVILGLLLSAFAGCEKNPARPEPEKPLDSHSVAVSDSVSDSDSLATLEITFKNESENYTLNENPRWNHTIRVYNEDSKKYTVYNFKGTKVVVDSVISGNYLITCGLSMLKTGNTRDNYIILENNVVVVPNQVSKVGFILPEELPARVYAVNNKQVPLRGVEISTVPETVTAITDDEGYADLGIIPFDASYLYTIKRYDILLEESSNGLKIENGVLELKAVVSYMKNLPLMIPVTKILSPGDNQHFINRSVHFIGNGYDLEDDLLPEESLVWHSSIDGELGTGRELVVDRLNIGQHIITLTGTDSDGKDDTSSIRLNLYFNDENTCFPLPYTGYWRYRYDTRDFTINDPLRGDEYWFVNVLDVSADDADTRNCLMEYAITRGDSTKYCRYEVVDHYETDAENIYISKTTEQLQIFENENTSGEPTEQLDIKTVYSPRYLLMKQFMDPGAESSYETSGAVEVTWDYRHSNSLSQTLTETIDISTSYEIGQTETIETGIGNYEAVPLTITSDGTERTLWLAKGIGIVRMAYDSFDFPLTATLSDTNVPSFSGVGPSVVMKSALRGNNNNWIAFDSLPETPERMMELSKILRGLCPR